MTNTEKTYRSDIGSCTKFWPANTDSGVIYQDATGEVWTEMPHDPPIYSHLEGSYMVNGDPVHTCGDLYMLDYALADYLAV